VSDSEHPVPAPPAGEELHLPGPSILPFACAIALTLVVIGTTINIIISIVGLIAFVIIVIRWVADVRRDVAELPESHH
jgi:Flp pilus assembly protein TadB